MTEFIRMDALPSVVLVKPTRHGDARGFFMETYRRQLYSENGIDCEVVQDNHSYSAAKGVMRGLHFQTLPNPQAKLVRCTRGRILDVAVDIRHGSPTFGQHVAVELSAENGWQLFVPVGFAHGFCTIEEDCEVQYKCSGYYSAPDDGGALFSDPDIGIDWPVPVEEMTISDKDQKQPRLKALPVLFKM